MDYTVLDKHQSKHGDQIEFICKKSDPITDVQVYQVIVNGNIHFWDVLHKKARNRYEFYVKYFPFYPTHYVIIFSEFIYYGSKHSDKRGTLNAYYAGTRHRSFVEDYKKNVIDFSSINPQIKKQIQELVITHDATNINLARTILFNTLEIEE